MALILLLTAFAVASSMAAPVDEAVDPSLPPTWMGTCGDKEEDQIMFKTKLEAMQRCYENVFNSSTGIPKEFQDGLNSSETEQVPCASLMNYVTCVDDFLGALGQCFEEDHQVDMQITANGTRAMFSTICQGIARESFDVSAQTSDGECLQAKESEMFACFGDKPQESSVAEMAENSNMAVSLLDMFYDENTCSTLHDVWHCINKVFSSCANSTLLPIIQEGMFQFYDMTPCDKLLTTANPADTSTAFFFA